MKSSDYNDETAAIESASTTSTSMWFKCQHTFTSIFVFIPSSKT